MKTPTALFDMPGHLIRRLNQHSTAQFQRHLKSAGWDITSVQFAALKTLADHPNIDQATLAAMIEYDRATIGGVLKRLEQKGQIQRKPNAEDKRAFKLSLTPCGAALLADVLPLVLAAQNDILGHLTEAERDTFLTLVQKALRLDDHE